MDVIITSCGGNYFECTLSLLSLLFSVIVDSWFFIYSIIYRQLQTLFFLKLKLSLVWSLGSTSSWLLCPFDTPPLVFESLFFDSGFLGFSMLGGIFIRIMSNIYIDLRWIDVFVVELSYPRMWFVFHFVQRYLHVF